MNTLIAHSRRAPQVTNRSLIDPTSVVPHRNSRAHDSASASAGRSSISKPVVGRRGPAPKVSKADICSTALSLLDREGPQALTSRRLAHELAISTKTLYKRIPSQGALLDELGDLWAANVTVSVQTSGTWEAVARRSFLCLYMELTAHPHLTAILSNRVVDHLMVRFHSLIAFATSQSIAPEMARRHSRMAIGVVVNSAIAGVRPASGDRSFATGRRSVLSNQDLVGTLDLIVSSTRLFPQHNSTESGNSKLAQSRSDLGREGIDE